VCGLVDTQSITEERRSGAVEHVVIPAQRVRVGSVARQQTEYKAYKRVMRTADNDGRRDVGGLFAAGGRVQELPVEWRLLSDHTAVS